MLATPSIPEILPCPVVFPPRCGSPVETPAARDAGVGTPVAAPGGLPAIECVDDPDEDEDLVEDEEDLTVAQPAADDESNFDDFDDEFDDDFEEEENDPDWDHPDDAAQEPPPPGKGPGKKK